MKENPKQNKWLFAFIIACVLLAVAVTAVVILATRSPEDDGPDVFVGENETAMFYYDTVDGEMLLTLTGGNVFTLVGPGVNKTGTYAVVDNNVTLDFVRDEDGTASATLEPKDDTLVLTYQGATMTMARKVSYAVSFSCDGQVTKQFVVNGKMAVQPVDPVKDGHVFLGWFADEALTVPYTFDTSVVTSDVTLYAKFVATIVGQPEYMVDFVLGYEGAQNPEAVKTVGGKVHAMPADPVREGYTFCGWWISMTENAEKLSYRYSEELVFAADTTLFALWAENAGAKLQAPCVSVGTAGVQWDTVNGASGYHITVTDANGNVIVDEDLGATTRNVEFADSAAGEYKVEVYAVAPNTANNSDVAVRYYVNKMLDRVSQFQVIDGVLAFNVVEKAEKYLITIECGNPAHNHTLFDNGTSTNFRFADCTMQPGGIKITVTAVANGYADSVSETFVYDRTLAAVENVIYNAEEDIFVWDRVENAAGYTVIVTVGDKTETFHIGNKTVFSAGAYTGDITVEVIPTTAGYNSPDAATVTCKKVAPATPSGLKANGMVLTWDAAMGATSYEVKIGNQTFTANTNSLDLAAAGAKIEAGQLYAVSVKSINGAESSVYSEPVNMGYQAMNPNLTYSANTVYWTPVIGVNSYEVRVNGIVVASGISENFLKVTLTKAGINTIEVRFTDYGGSNWVSIEVNAFKITYNSRSLSGEISEYVAIGDTLSLPDHFTNNGYTFNGWYNSPAASQGNGQKVESNIFTGNADTVYYADWDPQEYNINVQVEGYELTNMEQGDFFTVTYTHNFTLPVPESSNPVYTSFVGWFNAPSGGGTKLTDENGVSVAPFSTTHDITAYPFFDSNILYFTQDSDGTYEVSAGPNIDNVTEVTIPYSYGGVEVKTILESAFNGCNSLRVVNIPNSIELVGSSAFSGAVNLEQINVYDVEGNHDVFYSSHDGVLIRHDMGAVFIDSVPRAKTGTFEMPEGITVIQNKTFQMSNLSKVIVSASVGTVSSRAFYRCEKLEAVEFKGGRTTPISLETYMIYSCPKVATIYLPANINPIPADLFSNLQNLTTIDVEPGGVVYGSVNGMLTNAQGDTILYAPNKIAGVFTVPQGIRHIGPNAFANHTGLTSIVIPNYVKSIDSNAFFGCSKVKSIVFSGNRKNDLTIGSNAFASCATLDSVVFEGSTDGSLEKGAITIGASAFAPAGEKRLRTVEFRDGVNVSAIGSGAFMNQSALYSLSFGNNIRVAEIGSGAFQGCSQLPFVFIPATTTRIGDNAFKGCTGIASVTFSEGGNEIQFGNGAFSGCTKITQINLPATLVNFNGSVFSGCDMVKQINVAEDSPYLTSENGVLYSKDYSQLLYYPKALDADWDTLSKLRWNDVKTIGNSVFAGNEKVTEFVIMKNVTSIGSNAFTGCVNLKKLTSEVQNAQAGAAQTLNIGSHAFSGCTKLSTASIPDYTTVIGDNAFEETCFSDFRMPSAVHHIGAEAFKKNKSLTAITIPSKVTTVGNGAFYNCTSLATVTFEEGELLALGTAYGATGVFQYCTLLRTVDMKNRATVIGSYAFARSGIRNDSMFTGIVLGDNITAIGNSAFSGAKSLQSITIPTSVTSIGNYAFSDTPLAQIEFASGGTEPLNFGDFVFKDTQLVTITFPKRTQTLYVNKKIGYAQTEVCGFADLFSGVSTLRDIHVEEGCAKFCSIDGVLYEYNAEGEIAVLLLCPVMNGGTVVDGVATGELRIPNTVVNVVNRALRDIRVIHTITFEEFDETDERYGTQRLILGVETPGDSIGNDLSVIGGLETNSITTINLPSHLSVIGCSAITETKDLVTLNVNPAATEIVLGKYAFNYSKIQSAVFSGVKKMETFSFAGAENLTTLVFGDKSTLNQLPFNGFNGAKFKTFVIPASVKMLDGQAFFYVETLESVSVAEGSALTHIGSSAFYNCTSLTNLDLSNATKLTHIGQNAFNHTKLSSFTFPESLQSLGAYIFRGCEYLTEVTLSSTFTASMLYSNGVSIFDQAPAIAAIHVDSENLELCSVDGVLYDKIISIVYQYPRARSAQGYQIPETVRVIEKGAFMGFTGTVLDLPKNLEKIENQAFEEARVESFVIPAGVTSIGARAFASAYDAFPLKSVTFEAGSKLESIGEEAFFNCGGLGNISLPDTVKTIGAEAFYGCQSMDSIILPAALTVVPNMLFINCKALRSVVLQHGITEIGVSAFNGTLIASIHIPASVRIIGEKCFKEMEKLTSVTFAQGSVMDSIGNSAFESCRLLQYINIPAGVRTIGTNAFKNNGNLVVFDIPTGLTEIPEGMLDGCRKVASISIPGTVTAIGARAFANNASIPAIEIPAAVATIGNAAFEGCSSANRILFADGSALKELGSDVTGEDNIFKGTTKALTVKLPANLTIIGGHVFEGCGMRSLTIPTSVIEIGQYAFSDCDKLQNVTVPGTVSYLGDYAFFDCDNLKNANLSVGVEYLGTLVFGFCDKLTKAYIPATVIRIGSNPFAGCFAAGDVVVDPENEYFQVDDGVLYDLSKTVLYHYPTTKTEETFVIPDTVTEIAAGAFAGSNLTAIEFPARLVSIAPYTFAYSKKLEAVSIENGVTEIGDGAFRGCSALNNVVIPSSAATLGDYAFADCSSLSKFTFNGSNTFFIGGHFFENCTSMKDVILPQKFSLTPKEAAKYGLIQNDGKLSPSAAQAIPGYMFAGTGIVNAQIPSTVKWLGTDGVFMNCKYMKSVKFASKNISCKHIGNYYFYGCSSLTELDIPRGATAIFSNTIGYSFANCTSLKSITINYANVLPFAPASSGHMFEGCSSLTSVIFKGLGSSVTYMDYVGPYFFAGCTSLREITLDDYAAVYEHAFENCTSLMYVSFGSDSNPEDGNLVILGDYAFAGCTGNTGMYLAKVHGYMGQNVFEGWTEEQAIKTYESAEEVLEYLSTGIFKGCKAAIFDKNFNPIEIDPVTGLPKNP